MLTALADAGLRITIAAIWLVAAASKVSAPKRSVAAARELLHPTPEILITVAAVMLPVGEIALAVTALIEFTSTFAVSASALLFVIFAVILARARRRGVRTGCNCFGRSNAQEVTRFAILRALIFALLAFVAAVTASLAHQEPVLFATRTVGWGALGAATFFSTCLGLLLTTSWLLSDFENQVYGPRLGS
jgi:heme/copper-type cytochrome/quinol oxidase subunit 2